MFGGRNHLAPLHLYCHWCKVLSPTIPEFWLLLVSARCSYESHSTHTPVKPGQSNMPSASGQPLPSAAAAQLQQLVTSSRSRRLSQKVCLFTKPRQTRHLPCRRVQSLSRVIWAGQWKMKAQTGAGALEHVSGWCSQRPADGQVEEGRVWEMRTARMGGGLSPGQVWGQLRSCLIHFDMCTPPEPRLWVWGAMSRDLSDALWDAPFVY